MFYYFVKVGSALLLAVLIYFVGMGQGCSPTRFSSLRILPCSERSADSNCQIRPVSCRENPAQMKCIGQKQPKIPGDSKDLEWDTTQTEDPVQEKPKKFDECAISHYLSLGEVDILFVIDNSSSMAEEHRSLARQFSSFLNDIKNVDYHIAVITTDISSSPNDLERNQYNPVRNHYYQDGRFIPIGNRKFLKNENLGGRPSQRVVEDFKKAIEREETKRCDTRNQPKESEDKYDRLYYRQKTQERIGCPSSDERGTYAVNLALKNPAHRAFFGRPDAHFMIVILSDEDIRSGEEYINQPDFEKYQLTANDDPEVLVENIYNHFKEKTKTFSVYSIIIPPGDSRCLEEQNRNRAGGSGSGRGYYGREYARLSEAGRDLKSYGNLLKGGVISICSRNYGYQLRRVAVSAQISRVSLSCPQPESIDLYVNNSRVRSEQEIEGRTLIIRPRSDIPLSSRLKVREICPVAPGQPCD
ncbi:MAG: hypothetical protein OXJ52_06180 [Oligoflexia bacterium]|nr:hypothetical protein [Oligoflexia bacterium]